MTFSTFGAVEWIAFVMAAVGIIKMLTLFVNKSAWINGVSRPILRSKATPVVAGLLTLYLFYLLLPVFGIVNIFAVMGLIGVFYGMTFVLFDFPIDNYIKSFVKAKWTAGQVILSLVWLALSVWVLFELF
jgi:hypothetical protein